MDDMLSFAVLLQFLANTSGPLAQLVEQLTLNQ